MKKSHFTFVLIATLISVTFLSTAWEFWLEDIVFGALYGDYEVESVSIRLEYIISIIIFVSISLIFPAAVGYKLIESDEKMQSEIKRLAEEDYLTRLYNRRKIHEIIDNEIIRSKRYNSAFAVILIDIDDFKNINDTHGHNTGDRALVQFSTTLRQTIRESDIAGRWGGEEFLIICPETTIAGALSLAEKLRGDIEKNEFSGIGKMTASFGVTGIKHGDNARSMIHRADKALYSAKQAGKNRVSGTA